MTSAPGASRAEWDHWSLWLGLTTELLPVVSRRDAVISPYSTLRTVGKVPSRYDAQGRVVGIPHWTAIRATLSQVDHWSSNGDLGICLQTRHLCAIDIDVDDPGKAAAIRGRVADVLGLRLPARARPGSSRALLVCRRDAGRRKQTVQVAGGGAIELLGDGNQFIAAGTHPSGGRYFWEGGLPPDIPLVDAAALEHLAAVLQTEFGPGSPQRGAHSGSHEVGVRRQPDPDRPARRVADPVADWLVQRGWLRGEGRKGEHQVWCPWLDDHTGDSGETEAVWWPAGTGGYEQGHFKCLHAHCAARTDEEFLQAVGWPLSMLPEVEEIHDDVEEGDGVAHAADLCGDAGVGRGGDSAGHTDRVPGGAAGAGALVQLADGTVGGDPAAIWRSSTPGQGLKRGRKGFAATVQNLQRALQTAGWWQQLGYDRFRDEIMRSTWTGANAGAWVPFLDEDYTRLRVALERARFEPVGREMIRDVVRLVARENAFDSAQLWLDGLSWDGMPRAERFLEAYCGVEDTPYHRAVSLYLWTALAGRVMSPGCQADMVPVLVAGQGVKKSTLVASLCPSPEYSTRIDLSVRDAELLRKLRGRLVAEWAELRGLQTRERQAINDFVTGRNDSWVPKFVEFAHTAARRFLIIGTANDEQILTDETGNRRWLPVTLSDAQIDIKSVERDRDQLWAEGAALWRAGGIAWRAAERLAIAEHPQYMADDTWADLLQEWVETPCPDSLFDDGESSSWGARGFTTREALTHCCATTSARITRADEMHCARALKLIGFSRRIILSKNGRREGVWGRRLLRD